MNYFSGLKVFRFNHCPDFHQSVDCTLETYALNYIRQGRCTFASNGNKPIQLHAPAVFWTWPGPRWQYGAVPGHLWDHSFVSWKGDRTRTFLKTNLFPNTDPASAYLRLTDPIGFERAFFGLLQLLQTYEPDHPMIVNRLEGALLLLHHQPATSTALTGIAVQISDLIDRVRVQPTSPWDFLTESRQLGCTPAYLRRVWKAQTGLTPIGFLQKHRMNQAAVLLRQNQRSVDQIMREVGYDHPGYFYRLFRAQYGMAPGEYAQAFQSAG